MDTPDNHYQKLIIANNFAKYYKDNFYIIDYKKTDILHYVRIKMDIVELTVYKDIKDGIITNISYYYDWRNGKRDFDFTLDEYKRNFHDLHDVNRYTNDFDNIFIKDLDKWFV